MGVEKSGKKGRAGGFFANLLRGAAIGVAFIIPGFSGGSVAALLGIYERMVGAVAGLFRNFRESFRFLFPVGLGLILGASAFLYPVGYALSAFPIPTVSLFVGLALGGLPVITREIGKKPTFFGGAAFFFAFCIALALCLLPGGKDRDLFGLDTGGYALLFLVGTAGAAALVVPGISGSMLLLSLGYYRPLVTLITDYLLCGRETAQCIGVLLCAAAGIVAGFFAISVLMKRLLERFPRATYCAILGFIVGSVPAAFFATAKDAGMTAVPTSPAFYLACVCALALGWAAAFCFARFAARRGKDKKNS